MHSDWNLNVASYKTPKCPKKATLFEVLVHLINLLVLTNPKSPRATGRVDIFTLDFNLEKLITNIQCSGGSKL